MKFYVNPEMDILRLKAMMYCSASMEDENELGNEGSVDEDDLIESGDL